MDKDYTVIKINYSNGRHVHIEIPKDAKIDTLVEQSQEWVPSDDSMIGETSKTVITGVHIDVKDMEGKIKIEEFK